MTKDNSEVLLDGLVHATEWAEEEKLQDLADFLGALYQVGGQVVFGDGDKTADHPSAETVLATIASRSDENSSDEIKKTWSSKTKSRE